MITVERFLSGYFLQNNRVGLFVSKLTVEEIKVRRRVVCICRAIPMGRILDAIQEKGCKTVAEINSATGCGRGDCGGQRCGPVIRDILAQRENSDQ